MVIEVFISILWHGNMTMCKVGEALDLNMIFRQLFDDRI